VTEAQRERERGLSKRCVDPDERWMTAILEYNGALGERFFVTRITFCPARVIRGRYRLEKKKETRREGKRRWGKRQKKWNESDKESKTEKVPGRARAKDRRQIERGADSER